MIATLLAFASILGSWICHQLPERTLSIAGVPLPVCARCTGIYVGVGIALATRGRWRRNWMLAALGMVALDWASEAFGLRPAWAPMRVLTGAMLGYAASPAVSDALREWTSGTSTSHE